MTEEGLKYIISHSEGTEIEYKKSQTELARSVFESICAFLNRRGGHVVLGADNDGKIVGIDPGKVQGQIDTLAKDMNNPQLINPPFYLNFEPMDIDGKKIIYFYVPESSQAHSYKGVFYDRNQDGDFALRTNQQIADMMQRKQHSNSEDRVFPYLTMADFDSELFDIVRNRIRMNRPDHLWPNLSNHDILRSAGMWLRDPETGKEGYTLAAAMLFGNDRTIHMVAPFYKIDAICRQYNTDLYDDRDKITCNLLRAYGRLMDFCKRHLPEWPVIDGDQRKSIRDIIFREICMNILIHTEYDTRHSSLFNIWKDKVEIINWNIPFNFGLITLDNLRPHAKNPAIANFFSQLDYVEEIGKGTRTMFEYVPRISGGQEPIIEEKDEFKVTIPYLMAGPAAETTEKTTGKTTGKTTEKILQLIKENPIITMDEIASACEITQDGAYYHIKKLRDKGILIRIGGRKDGHWEIAKPQE